MKWMPIETAPRDGTSILVYLEAELLGSRIHAAQLRPNISIVATVFAFDAPKMTHWAEMPIPPED